MRRTFESTGIQHQKIKGEWGYERVTLSAGSDARNESETERQGENVSPVVRYHGLCLSTILLKRIPSRRWENGMTSLTSRSGTDEILPSFRRWWTNRMCCLFGKCYFWKRAVGRRTSVECMQKGKKTWLQFSSRIFYEDGRPYGSDHCGTEYHKTENTE